jgi:putative addiction module antidote
MNEHSQVKPDPQGQAVGVVEIKKIGNSSGVILPKDILARLNVGVGDEFSVSLTPEGGIRLTPRNPYFDKAMEIARRGMKRYRNALAELAK